MPTNDYLPYLQHHGILGMKWGIRRYQPYSVTGPRSSGKTGKEVGKAKKVEKRLNKLDKKIVIARHKTSVAKRKMLVSKVKAMASTPSTVDYNMNKSYNAKKMAYAKASAKETRLREQSKALLNSAAASGKFDIFTAKVSRSSIGLGKTFARVSLLGALSLAMPSTWKRSSGTKYKIQKHKGGDNNAN